INGVRVRCSTVELSPRRVGDDRAGRARPGTAARRRLRLAAVYRAIDRGVAPGVPAGSPITALARNQVSGTKSYSPTPWSTRKVAELSPALVTRCGRCGRTA